MSKQFHKNRLGLELVAAAVCSAMVALVLYLVFSEAGYRGLEMVKYREDRIEKQEAGYIRELQTYVAEQNLSIQEVENIFRWQGRKKQIGLILFDDEGNIALYDIKENVFPSLLSGYVNSSKQYPISFKDGTLQASLFHIVIWDYTAVTAVAALAAGLIFVVIIFWFISKKVEYILLLKGELEILGGGDLDYQVTVKGKDELASLAQEVDAMRKAIKERQEMEEMTREASLELVTAMSHDLRTPLTALIGYMDILSLEKEMPEEKKERYLKAGREKAYQIKGMSDKLFEYFLAYNPKEELEMERVNGAEFLGQIVEESLFDLESEGFTIIRSYGEIKCGLHVNIELMQRVFGNIFSNLLKYANCREPVEVMYREEQGYLLIQFSNCLAERDGEKESTNIGLKTCEKIIRNHGGEFQCKKENGKFQMTMRLPVC